MAELKPCPFCGSPVEFRGVPGERTMIRCTKEECYMFYPAAFTSWHNGDTEEHARLRLSTAWNRRETDGNVAGKG